MKKYFRVAFVLCSLMGGYFSALGQDWDWVLGSGGYCQSDGTKVKTDSEGNVYVRGEFGKPASYVYDDSITLGKFVFKGAGSFIAKYDRNGQLLWARRDTSIATMAVDESGNQYHVSLRNNSIGQELFLKQYDANGKFVSTKTILSAGYVSPATLLVDAEHNFYINGYIGTKSGTTSVDSCFWLKCDAEGKIAWKRSTAGSSIDFHRDGNIAIDGEGNLIVTGIFYDTINIEGTTLTCDSISATFLAKYDKNGTLVWIRSSQIFTNVAYVWADSSGNTYQAGDSGNVPYIVKYNPSGEVLWKKNARGYGYPFGVVTDPGGNVYFTGWYYSPISMGSARLEGNSNCSNLFLFKLDVNGEVQWGFSGNSDCSVGAYLATDKYGNCYLTGSHVGDIVFGKETLKGSASAYSLFVAKFGGMPLPLEKDEDVLLYPNPVSDQISVKCGKKHLISDVAIFNAIGEKVREYHHTGTYWLDINNLSLPDGFYLFNATGSSTFVIPFIVKH